MIRKMLIDFDMTMVNTYALLCEQNPKYDYKKGMALKNYDLGVDREDWKKIDYSKITNRHIFEGVSDFLMTANMEDWEVEICTVSMDCEQLVAQKYKAIYDYFCGLFYRISFVGAPLNKMTIDADLIIDDRPLTVLKHKERNGSIGVSLSWPWITDDCGYDFTFASYEHLYDCINRIVPAVPSIREVRNALIFGKAKREGENWEAKKHDYNKVLLPKILRHLGEYPRNQNADDSGLSHLAHAAANCLIGLSQE